MSALIILIVACLCYGCKGFDLFSRGWPKLTTLRPRSVSKESRKTLIAQPSSKPIVKKDGKPVLIVEDAASGSRVHLVGVSHGSPASAALVETVMDETKPACVVLELCEDRFISISLDAKIRPGEYNSTWTKSYDEKVVLLEKKLMSNTQRKDVKARFGQKGAAIVDVFSQFYGAFNFARGQGPIAGLFVILGLFVSCVQKLTRAKTVDDEFVTAMRLASERNIPVRLGDAAQNDTLNSIKQIVSMDTFNFQQIWEGSQLLLFSAFGLLSQCSNKRLSDTIPTQILQQSAFLNIPKAYAEDKAMLKSILPFIALVASTFLWDFSPALDWDAASSIAGIPLISSLQIPLPYISEDAVTFVIDLLALLLLIRMTKLIGTDRDVVLAQNIKNVLAELPPQSDVVVVIGMLHTNGIARWLLSGQNPQTFISSPPSTGPS